MENKKIIPAFISSEHQEELRNKLSKYWLNNPQTHRAFSKTIGISYLTLHKFLFQNQDIKIRTLMIVHKFLENNKGS